jgi:hypothetical protein
MNDYKAGIQKIVVVDPSGLPLDYLDGIQKVEVSGGVTPAQLDTKADKTTVDALTSSLADKASQASLNATNANVTANTSALGDKATEVYPEKYGAVGDGVADDRVALTSAFAYAMTNKLPVVLKDGKTYLINSIPVSGNVFDITGALKLRGNATIKMGTVGDYDTIFNLKTGCNYSEFLYFTLDENTTGNPKTVNTGASGKRRVAFYSWNGTGNKTSFIRFKGVTLNDCIGVWQITLNTDNVKINRCTINYSSAGTVPAFDRTCVYMAGTNWNVYENTLNGSANAHTCMETHGSNITVFNNKAFNYDNVMYIVNDSAGASAIDNISVIDNNFNCRFGIRLWFQVDNVNVDTVNINNNKITVTGASSAFSTYEVTGNNITVNNVKFTNNVVNLNSQTDSFVQLRNTESATKTGVTYNDFNIENNTFNGVCQYAIKLEVQPQKVQLFHRLNINKNTFNITNLYSDRLLYMIDVPVGFEDVMLFANKFKVLAVTGFTTTRILHGSTASRTSGYGAIKLRQNEYSLPSWNNLCFSEVLKGLYSLMLKKMFRY